MSASVLPPPTTSTATAAVPGGFPVVFPAVGQSVSGIYPGFPAAVMPTSNQNNHRLRAPTSAVVVVHQEDARDIAGLP